MYIRRVRTPSVDNDVLDMAYSPNGTHLAVLLTTSIIIWNTVTWRRTAHWRHTEDSNFSIPSTRLVWHPFRHRITTYGSTVTHWDAHTGRLLRYLGRGTRGLQWLPDGRLYAAADEQDIVRVFRTNDSLFAFYVFYDDVVMVDLAVVDDSTILIALNDHNCGYTIQCLKLLYYQEIYPGTSLSGQGISLPMTITVREQVIVIESKHYNMVDVWDGRLHTFHKDVKRSFGNGFVGQKGEYLLIGQHLRARTAAGYGESVHTGIQDDMERLAINPAHLCEFVYVTKHTLVACRLEYGTPIASVWDRIKLLLGLVRPRIS